MSSNNATEFALLTLPPSSFTPMFTPAEGFHRFLRYRLRPMLNLIEREYNAASSMLVADSVFAQVVLLSARTHFLRFLAHLVSDQRLLRGVAIAHVRQALILEYRSRMVAEGLRHTVHIPAEAHNMASRTHLLLITQSDSLLLTPTVILSFRNMTGSLVFYTRHVVARGATQVDYPGYR